MFAVLPALVNQAARLGSDAIAILDRIGLLRIDSFLFRSQRYTDQQLGSVVEAVSSTPLLISKQQADVALWRQFSHDLELGSCHNGRVGSDLTVRGPEIMHEETERSTNDLSCVEHHAC